MMMVLVFLCPTSIDGRSMVASSKRSVSGLFVRVEGFDRRRRGILLCVPLDRCKRKEFHGDLVDLLLVQYFLELLFQMDRRLVRVGQNLLSHHHG